MDIDNCVIIRLGHREYIVDRAKALDVFDVLSRLDLSYCFDTHWDSDDKGSKPIIKLNPFEVALAPLNKSEYVVAASHPKSDPIN